MRKNPETCFQVPAMLRKSIVRVIGIGFLRKWCGAQDFGGPVPKVVQRG